jgi:hypothetical protein
VLDVVLVQLIAVLLGVSVVQAGAKAGALQGGFKRTLAGAGATYTSGTALSGFSSTESFIRASLDGDLSIGGYLFVLGLLVVAFVWLINLFETRAVIR